MFVLVTGGSGSGKSEFAEDMAAARGKSRLYIATMKPYDDECFRRIARHREMRKNKGFETIESYGDLSDIKKRADTILVECISNLAANVMFSGDSKNAYERIVSGIMSLNCDDLVVVTNEVSSDGITYDTDTEKYIKLLGSVNAALARHADEVYEIVYGIPVRIK